MIVTRFFILLAAFTTWSQLCCGQVYLKCTIVIADEFTCSRELVTIDPIATISTIESYHIVDSVKIPSSIGTMISWIVEYCDVVDAIKDDDYETVNSNIKIAIDNSPGDTLSRISGDTTFTIVLKEVVAKWRYQLCYRPYYACDSSLPLVVQHAAYPTDLFYAAKISVSLLDRIKQQWSSRAEK